jgi:hypothetical protein
MNIDPQDVLAFAPIALMGVSLTAFMEWKGSEPVTERAERLFLVSCFAAWMLVSAWLYWKFPYDMNSAITHKWGGENWSPFTGFCLTVGWTAVAILMSWIVSLNAWELIALSFRSTKLQEDDPGPQ